MVMVLPLPEGPELLLLLLLQAAARARTRKAAERKAIGRRVLMAGGGYNPPGRGFSPFPSAPAASASAGAPSPSLLPACGRWGGASGPPAAVRWSVPLHR